MNVEGFIFSFKKFDYDGKVLWSLRSGRSGTPSVQPSILLGITPSLFLYVRTLGSFSTSLRTDTWHNPLMESVSKRSLRGYQVLCDLYKVYTSDLIRFHDSAPYVQNNFTHDQIHVAFPLIRIECFLWSLIRAKLHSRLFRNVCPTFLSDRKNKKFELMAIDEI